MFIELEEANLTYMGGTAFEANAVNNISFSLGLGDCVGIIGPTGSGKSTLGQVLAGLLKPDSGTLTIDGRKVPEELRASQVYRDVGFLFQKPEKQMFENTVYEEVAFGPKNLGLPESEIESAVKNALNIVGLDFGQYRGRSPFNLSGGEMRRVGIASVLALQSKAFILDEPTAGLDVRGKSLVIDYLKQVKASGKSIVLISHDLAEVLELCERIIVLNKGAVVLTIEIEQILQKVDYLAKLGLILPEEYMLAKRLQECGYKVDGFSRQQIIEAIGRKIG